MHYYADVSHTHLVFGPFQNESDIVLTCKKWLKLKVGMLSLFSSQSIEY